MTKEDLNNLGFTAAASEGEVDSAFVGNEKILRELNTELNEMIGKPKDR